MKKLSVVIVTRNEEANIGDCLKSVKEIADEMIVFDEQSTDKTVRIAQSFGAKVTEVVHLQNFHLNKQKAAEAAHGDWLLCLDADERVSNKLASEIKDVINMNNDQILARNLDKDKLKLFRRHQQLLKKSSGNPVKKTKEIVAFFLPRRNIFLGKPLIHAGVYPDGVIRLVKKGYGFWPAKSVHETMQINGEVSWLENDLEHHDSPTFSRYLDRLNRYTDLKVEEFKINNLKTNYFNLVYYSSLKPLFIFISLYLRHKGFMDGFRGFVWSLFSSLHYPIAYFKYYQMSIKD